MKKMLSLIVLTAMILTMVVGASASAETVKIGLSEPSLGWPYIAAYAEAFKGLLENNADVEAVVLSADGDIEKQTNDINDLIVQEVDVIMVCSLDGEAVIPALAQADAAGIPVLAVSNEPGEAGKQYLTAYCGPDDYVEGGIAAKLMLEGLGYTEDTQDELNFIIIEGTAGQSTTQLRRDAFEAYMAEHAPNAKILDSQPCDWDSTLEKSAMQAFITKYGDKISGVFAEGNSAATAEVCHENGCTFPVVGVGFNQPEKDAIEGGYLYGAVCQAALADASLGLEKALEIAGGTLVKGNYERFIIDMPTVTAANIAETELDF